MNKVRFNSDMPDSCLAVSSDSPERWLCRFADQPSKTSVSRTVREFSCLWGFVYVSQTVSVLYKYYLYESWPYFYCLNTPSEESRSISETSHAIYPLSCNDYLSFYITCIC